MNGNFLLQVGNPEQYLNHVKVWARAREVKTIEQPWLNIHFPVKEQEKK